MRAMILLTIGLVMVAPARAAEESTRLSSAFITGSNVYTVTQFAPIIGRHVGQPVSRALIEELTAEIQAIYRQDGYVIPTVIASDSELISSTPRLHIFEAQIAEIAVRGDCGPYRGVIMANAEPLQSTAIHKQRSRTYLRKIEALPGITLRPVFEPRPAEPYRYNLVLNVSYRAVDAGAYVHNRGTEDLGRTMIGGRARFNGLLGAQESVTLRAAGSHDFGEYRYVAGHVERNFSAMQTSFGASSSRIDDDWQYSSNRARIEARVTLFDDGALRIDPLAAFSVRDSEGREVEGDYFSSIRTRAIEAGVVARRASGNRTTELRSVIEQGIDGLGASAVVRNGTTPDLTFTKAVIEGEHVHALASSWRVRLELDSQYSTDTLPAGERFTFGGSRFGRGFDPGALIGDSGGAISVQLEHSRRWQNEFFNHGRIHVQADYGYARFNRSGHSRDAASVTTGFSVKVASVLASLELSQPLDLPADGSDTDGLRAFVYVQLSL